MFARIAHQLRGRVETHRLTVEKRGSECCRMMALEPCRHIDQERKARCVTLRKSVTRETLNLPEHLRSKLFGIPTSPHAGLQLILECSNLISGALPCSDGAAQFVRLTGRKAGCYYGKQHRLLLKEWHTKRLSKDGANGFVGIVRCISTVAPTQVWVHHIPLNWPRAHNGNFNHQVIETARFQARQHTHLRAAFDLKYPHRVGATRHFIRCWVFSRNGAVGQHSSAGTIARPARHRAVVSKINRFTNSSEHPQCQYVHLQHAHGINIIFIPLNDGARIHARVAHWHKFAQRTISDDESANMLRKMTWEPFYCRGNPHRFRRFWWNAERFRCFTQ